MSQPPEAARRRRKFFGDRLGYPAISMNFKTESFTYVILLIFTHFVISLTFNFLMIPLLFSEKDIIQASFNFNNL